MGRCARHDASERRTAYFGFQLSPTERAELEAATYWAETQMFDSAHNFSPVTRRQKYPANGMGAKSTLCRIVDKLAGEYLNSRGSALRSAC
jgi:hypothetical protein